MMKEVLTRYDDEIMRHIEACWRAVQDEVLKIMRDRFGLQTIEEVVKFLDGKKACLAWKDQEFVGVTLYNRWLYTTTGQVIGKEGKRWMIEKIKQSL